MTRKVLILSRPSDRPFVRPIEAAIHRRGGHALFVDTQRLPHDGGVSWRGPGDATLTLPSGESVDVASLHSIWLRRFEVGRGLYQQNLPQDVARAAEREARHVIEAVLLDSPAFWVDAPAVCARARNKALQLRLAQQVGLRVPRTLETNDPRAARRFLDQVQGPVVAKMFNDARVGGGTVYTNVITPDDREALDDLEVCPMILQERIDKALELRIVVVGDHVVAMALPTPQIQGAQQDWRRVGEQTLHLWQPYALDRTTQASILALHRELHTNYGSADAIVTPEGELVFLENNVQGESFWMMERFGLAERFADLLLADQPVNSAPLALC